METWNGEKNGQQKLGGEKMSPIEQPVLMDGCGCLGAAPPPPPAPPSKGALHTSGDRWDRGLGGWEEASGLPILGDPRLPTN